MTTALLEKGLVFSVIVLFVGASIIPSISGDNERNIVTYEDFDVGIIPPSTIVNGDIRSTGEDSYSITIVNNGDVPASVELDFKLDLLDGFEWGEVDSGSKGPYDLDPDVWIESFFDVSYDSEGEYRATFSLDSPMGKEDWSDDNPENDKFEVLFSVRLDCEVDKWYVDDDASSGGDGSKSRPFQTINEAITNVQPGDRIYVYDGIYNENLQIDKHGITISSLSDYINQPLSDCIIDGGGNGNVVQIDADRVSISGFIIRNSGSYEEDAAFDITSDYNIVSWNIIEENGASGIYLHDSAKYNYIHHNMIQNNEGAGIFIWEQSTNNWIYHNDFIQNTWYNVKDKEGGNIWNNKHPYGGNYWDDYGGTDTNGDGIGETPYEIRGDHDQTGLDECPWTEPHQWNNEPAAPGIVGPINGENGKEYEYEFSVSDEHFGPGSDPFTEPAVCHVDWGDGTEQWYGPIYMSSSNDIKITLKHTWKEQGTYNLKAQVIDGYGLESEWSNLQVSMPKNKQYMPLGIILAFGFDVDVKIVQLEPGEDYVDLEVLSKPFYIWENEIQTINPGAFIRLYFAKGFFSPSVPICFGICEDWGIIG